MSDVNFFTLASVTARPVLDGAVSFGVTGGKGRLFIRNNSTDYLIGESLDTLTVGKNAVILGSKDMAIGSVAFGHGQGELSHFTGSKGFRIKHKTNINADEKTGIYWISGYSTWVAQNSKVPAFSAKDIYTVRLESHFDMYGEIISIIKSDDDIPHDLNLSDDQKTEFKTQLNNGYTGIYITNIPEDDLVTGDISSEKNTFRVHTKPTCGDVEIGTCGFIHGIDCQATGKWSYAGGYNCKAVGRYSHAEGNSTTAGYAAHSEGNMTTARGWACHAEGWGSKALGNGSHAEGHFTTAKAYRSHTEGDNTIATRGCQHVQGKFNYLDANGDAGDYAHIIGWGDDKTRKNIHTVDTKGNAWYSGKITIDNILPANFNDVTTKAYVDGEDTCILRTDVRDPAVTLGSNDYTDNTPNGKYTIKTTYTTDIDKVNAPYSTFGGVYITQDVPYGATASNRWMLQTKLNTSLDLSDSNLVGIWLKVEKAYAGTIDENENDLTASITIEFTSSGREDYQERAFILQTADNSLVTDGWHFYILDLANAKTNNSSAFIGYATETEGNQNDETYGHLAGPIELNSINFSRIICTMSNARILVGKIIKLHNKGTGISYNSKGIFKDTITIGNTTITESRLNSIATVTKVVCDEFSIGTTGWQALNSDNAPYTIYKKVEIALNTKLTDNSIVQFMMNTLKGNNNINVATHTLSADGRKVTVEFYAVSVPSTGDDAKGKVVCFNVGV